MGMRKKKTLLDSATEAADGIRPAIESAVEKAIPLIQEAREKAAPYVAEGKALAAEAAEKAGPKIAEAREKAAPYVAEAREKAAPYVAEAREKAAEKAAEAREKAAPLLAEGKAFAAETAASGRDKVNELRGVEPEPSKGSKLKKLLFFGVLIGIGGAIFKKLRGGQPGDNWQSTYVPAPPPAAKSTADSAAGGAEGAEATAERTEDDQAAATPDEALSDRVEEPHPDTTPDDPAEVVDLKGFADTPEADTQAAQETDPSTAPVAEAAAEAEAGDTPYGEGSAQALEDGSAPDASYTIKGNAGSMLFHTTESPSFERTKAEVWFTTEEAATAAGFKPWNHKQQG